MLRRKDSVNWSGNCTRYKFEMITVYLVFESCRLTLDSNSTTEVVSDQKSHYCDFPSSLECLVLYLFNIVLVLSCSYSCRHDSLSFIDSKCTVLYFLLIFELCDWLTRSTCYNIFLFYLRMLLILFITIVKKNYLLEMILSWTNRTVVN